MTAAVSARPLAGHRPGQRPGRAGRGGLRPTRRGGTRHHRGRSERRLAAAAAAGIGDVHLNIVDAADAEAVLREARAAAGPDGADLVIECAGVPGAVAQGLILAGRGGSYLVIGQYTDAGDTELNPHQIVYRQLDVVGSWALPAITSSNT
ncbi:zinc-binding dehydrogenase [Streptomyces sp. NPDC001153]